MLTDLLIPNGAPLQILAATLSSEYVRVELTTTASSAPCTTCRSEAHRVHSRYQRTLADLPLAQRPLRLQLQVRRFYCDNLACAHKTFSETVPDMVIPYARRTLRLASEQRQLGLEVGGEVAARIAKRQGMPLSPSTILRLVRRAQPTELPTPTKLGIDDFALRKGHRYGTILVDLEKHCPVDLLPDRTAATLEAWLGQHPGVQLIARDRASEYADAARRAAPNAVQVADRFHLCQNVREMLQRLLERHQPALRLAAKLAAATPAEVTQAQTTVVTAAPDGITATPSAVAITSLPTAAPRLTIAAQQKQARRDRRVELYQSVQQRYAEGYSQRDIAKQLQLGRHTIRRLVVAAEFPERGTRRAVASMLDPFVPYLKQQMVAGQDNATELWRQLRDQQGYLGSRGLVALWVARHRDLCPPVAPAPAKLAYRGQARRIKQQQPQQAQRRCSARQAAFLLLRRQEELEIEDQQLLAHLCEQDPELQQARCISGEFLMLVRERKGERLAAWLARAEASGIAEIVNFAAGIRRDHAAVLAGLTLADNSGQVEGQVNRLKFIKRAGYGRAKFDLLRHRVLAA
jgi:transposase